MCAKAPLTLIELRLALASTQVAARFTATPTAATVTMMPPVTGMGWIRQLMASKATSAFRLGERVKHLLSLATGAHETAVPQAGQMS